MAWDYTNRGQGQSGRGSLNIAARNLIGHFAFDKIKVIWLTAQNGSLGVAN